MHLPSPASLADICWLAVGYSEAQHHKKIPGEPGIFCFQHPVDYW